MPSGMSATRGHTQNRCHTTATCQAPRGGSVGVNGGTGVSANGDVSVNGGGDEYEQMVHPSFVHRAVYKDPDYVYMHPAVARIPDSSYSNYDYVPPAATSLSTISEVERPTPYENHPLPRDLQNVVPVTFQPKYENVEAAKRSRVGSAHSDLYENVLTNGEQLTGNPGSRIYENVKQTLSPEGLHYLQVGVRAKRDSVNSVGRPWAGRFVSSRS